MVDVRNTVGTPGAGSVTAVAITPNGRYALAAVLDASNPALANPGALAFIDMAYRREGVVARVPLGVGPDAIRVTPDGLRVVVAVEDEAAAGGRPGSIQIVTLDYVDPARSAVTTLPVVPPIGQSPGDPQPEFVDISRDGTRALVSLQENNLVAVVDLQAETIERFIDLGTVSSLADTTADGDIALTQPFVGRREADSVCFLADGRHFVTANEGDTAPAGGQLAGGRGFSIFDTAGELLFDSGPALEQLATRFGQYPDSRSGARGIEVEGCTAAVFGGAAYAFLLGERNSSLFVVRVDDPARPELVQMLPAPFRPEGAVAIPGRNLVVVAGEGPNDGMAVDAYLGGGVWLYQGVSQASDRQAFPDNVLQARSDSGPFGAISGGSWNGVPGQVIVIPDVAFARQRIWTFQEDAHDAGARRMKLVGELLLTDVDGSALTGYDPEGLAVNPSGATCWPPRGRRPTAAAHRVHHRHGRQREAAQPPAVRRCAGPARSGLRRRRWHRRSALRRDRRAQRDRLDAS